MSPTLQVGPISEAELYAVLLNVLSNAIKSVIAKGGGRRVAVSAERDGRVSNIHVRDSGLGIPDSHYEDVFAPFVADPNKRLYRALKTKLNPEDEYIVCTGSGLGLSIVKEILSYRGGEVRFVPPKGSWRADLEISLP